MGEPGRRASRVRSARLRELTPLRLHGILRLRSDVFVVEQQCAYADMDGLDADPETVHLWIEEGGGEEGSRTGSLTCQCV